MNIPVVDFGSYGLSEEDVGEEQLLSLSNELKRAFTEVGFVFLKNTGITEDEVRAAETPRVTQRPWRPAHSSALLLCVGPGEPCDGRVQDILPAAR